MIHKVDPNRGILLMKSSKGWVATKLNRFNMVTDDEEKEFLGYDINNSLFNQALIPEELISNILSYITEESYSDITELDLFN